MILKERQESEELLLYRQLNLRMMLSKKDKHYYFNLEKGYIGELEFDQMLDKQRNNCLILNDLLLEINNTLFQLDKVMITPEKTYLYEVKNFEGDYYIEKENWFTLTKTEIKNPLLQLARSESSLRRLFYQLNSNSNIEARLVFINPEFHLYNSPMHLPILYPTQINRYINQLKGNPLKLNPEHYILAENLLALHVMKNPYSHVPAYTYENLKKGIICPDCGSFYIRMAEHHVLNCGKCRYVETVENAILRNVDELKLLFPNIKITTSKLYEWLQIIESKKIIRAILLKNFEQVGWGKSSHFVKKVN